MGRFGPIVKIGVFLFTLWPTLATFFHFPFIKKKPLSATLVTATAYVTTGRNYCCDNKGCDLRLRSGFRRQTGSANIMALSIDGPGVAVDTNCLAKNKARAIRTNNFGPIASMNWWAFRCSNESSAVPGIFHVADQDRLRFWPTFGCKFGW